MPIIRFGVVRASSHTRSKHHANQLLVSLAERRSSDGSRFPIECFQPTFCHPIRKLTVEVATVLPAMQRPATLSYAHAPSLNRVDLSMWRSTHGEVFLSLVAADTPDMGQHLLALGITQLLYMW
jgi:hypothetical protein